MQRSQREHLIRAAGEITNQCEFVVVGSQSIVGAMALPPARPHGFGDRRSQREADRRHTLFMRLGVREPLVTTTRLRASAQPGLHTGITLRPWRL
jgi:hypothetical protein